jgi:transcription elongation GreA/GreB family factor
VDETTLSEVTELLRGLLMAVERGELDASSPHARALLRRLEGATFALQLAIGDES